jgi:hypothetical protein
MGIEQRQLLMAVHHVERVVDVERSCDLLARNGWKREQKKRILGHGGCGLGRSSESDGFSTQFLSWTKPLRHIRQHQIPIIMNTTKSH